MSKIFLAFVEDELEKEGISIGDFVAENQINLFDNSSQKDTPLDF